MSSQAFVLATAKGGDEVEFCGAEVGLSQCTGFGSHRVKKRGAAKSKVEAYHC